MFSYNLGLKELILSSTWEMHRYLQIISKFLDQWIMDHNHGKNVDNTITVNRLRESTL